MVDSTPPLLPPPSTTSYPSGLDADRPYEYMSGRQTQNSANYGGGNTGRVDFSSLQPPVLYNNQNMYSGSGYSSAAPASSTLHKHPSDQHQYHQQRMQQQFHQGGRGHSLDSNLPPHTSYPTQIPEKGYIDSKAYANEVYMDHRDLQRARQISVQPGGGYPSAPDQGLRERGREELQGGISTLDKGYARPR